jgi:DNA helicase IV
VPSSSQPSDASPTDTTDPILTAERTHLQHSREALTRMRDRSRALSHSTGAVDWVSQQYFESSMSVRVAQLADSASTPLFFGRLDYDSGEVFHVGRRHVADDDGQALVVDWRAPISVPFYRATATDPMQVRRRRRFGFAAGALTSYEDEDLAAHQATDVTDSAILAGEIERPRVGPMRDIVATIQPDQDEIVRADITRSVCVQGAPGTGKTAVGLHRAAYLLYAHRDQLRRQRLLVVGPNAAFLRYIGAVLPALGEVDATQTTIDELVTDGAAGAGRLRVRGTEPVEVARLKGDARMATVLATAVWAHLREPVEGLVVVRGSRRYRVPTYQVAEEIRALRDRGVRYGSGRALLPQRLANAVLLRMEAEGDSPDDRVQNAVARSRDVKAYTDSVWPAIKPADLLFGLFSNPVMLAAAADGVLEADEQARLLWATPARSAGSTRWSAADAVLADELADLIERTPSLGHVVLDEAQDLSAMQLRAVGRRCSTGSITVLGDIAQGTTPWAAESWSQALSHLGKPAAEVEELTLGFRVPGQVLDFAARLLPHIAPELAPPRSVRSAAGELSVSALPSAKRLLADAATACARLLAERPGSIGLIVPDALVRKAHAALAAAELSHAVTGDADDAVSRLDLVPASMAKGLEFDHVVLVEPADLVAAEPDERTGLRRLYVCLTRAVTSLMVLHARPLPAALVA